MRIISFTILLMSCCSSMLAQKRTISHDTYKSWESLSSYKISNDGKYVWYAHSGEKGYSLVLASTDGAYKKIIPDIYEASFTEDSRFLIFNSTKGLAILKPGTEEPQYITGATQFSIPKQGDGRWLTYMLKGDLWLKDLSNDKEKTYAGVIKSWFNEQGTVLLLQTKSTIIWVNLPDGSQKTICQGSQAANVAFDKSGTQLAFTAQPGEPINPLMAFAAKKEKKKPQEVTLRYFKKNMDSALVKATNYSSGIASGFIIRIEAPSFSPDGKQLIFTLDKNKPDISPDSPIITDKVDIWSYKDLILQSEQLFGINGFHFPKYYTAVIPSSDNADHVIQLENADTILAGKPGNQYALVYNDLNTIESYWQPQQIPTYSLVSLHDGSRQTIPQQPKTFTYLSLSPAEHFVCWYDTLSKQYWSYDIAANTSRNISQTIPAILYTRENNEQAPGPYGIAGWLANDDAVLIYDKYDIWQLDPKGKKSPVNITAGYGNTHQISFRIADWSNSLESLQSGDSILVAALDNAMYNGFFKVKTGTSSSPRPGSMQPCTFYFPYMFANNPYPPIKAKNADIYVMEQQSAIQAPNVVVTRYFNTFTKLSDIKPQQNYNWMTSELLHWKMSDGRIGTGVLYKPENFDPNKKYPVIFHYYQKRSTEMYQFKTPGLSDGTLNIPLYVSNGYLVFVPDIIRFTGSPTEQILNSVESAARYLSSFSYVDATKMGLQGHSFGGYETNVVITHSNLFAVAQSSAGVSDLVSMYGGLGFGGKSLNSLLETNQFNLGTNKTPWQYQDMYRLNSPIFFADKITTPLLIMHNKNDNAVPFAQSVELFTALRRLQKPVWMLQYDEDGHTIEDLENRLDFSIRQQQFFDHYLKGAPAPIWMTQGIPATLKGIKTGL